MNEKNYLVSDEIKDIIDEDQFAPIEDQEAKTDTLFSIKLFDEKIGVELNGIIMKYSIRSTMDYKYTFKFLILSHELPSFMENMAIYNKVALLVDMQMVAEYVLDDKTMIELSVEQELVHSGYIITVSYQ